MSCRLKRLKQSYCFCVRAAYVWLILVGISEMGNFPRHKSFWITQTLCIPKCGLLPEQGGGGFFIISLPQNIQKYYCWALAALEKLATVIKDPFLCCFIYFIFGGQQNYPGIL